MKTFDLFLKQVITEKATGHEKDGKYQFFVRKDATKIDIREAFKKIYGVDVIKVNVMRTAGKTKMTKAGMSAVKKPALKKVIITTKSKKTVDILKPKIKA